MCAMDKSQVKKKPVEGMDSFTNSVCKKNISRFRYTKWIKSKMKAVLRCTTDTPIVAMKFLLDMPRIKVNTK